MDYLSRPRDLTSRVYLSPNDQHINVEMTVKKEKNGRNPISEFNRKRLSAACYFLTIARVVFAVSFFPQSVPGCCPQVELTASSEGF